MKFLKSILIIFLFLISLSGIKSQGNLDSLWSVWNDSIQADTNRLKAMSAIIKIEKDSAFIYYQLMYDFAKTINNKKWLSIALFGQGQENFTHGNYEKALELFKNSLSLKSEVEDTKGVGNTYLLIGNVFIRKGDYEKALKYYNKCLKIREGTGDKGGIASVLNNIGIICKNQGNKQEALVYYKKSLKLKEEIGEQKSIANTLNNIGNLYMLLENYDEALKHLKESLKLKEEIDIKNDGASLCNIGLVYIKQRKFDDALLYLKKSLKHDEETGNKSGVALLSIGKVYLAQEKFDDALIYFKKSLEISKQTGRKKTISESFGGIGSVYQVTGNYQEALNNYIEGIQIANEIGALDEIKNYSKSLYEIYKETGDTKKALAMHEGYVLAKDSLEKIAGRQEQYEFKVQKEYEIAKQTDSIKHADEIIIHRAEAKTQKQRSFGLFVIAIIVVFSLIVVFRQLRKVSFQKDIIEEKQKEITDSINYAKRLQQGILVPFDLVQSWLTESFILYKPKDIVSGDFYWIEKVDNRIYFAVADCTGHGVPGSLVSIICSNALTKSLHEDKLKDPSKLLDNTRQIVEERFSRSMDNITDGMDVSLCCLDLKTKKLTWSGAMLPLWIVKKNTNKVEVLNPDRQPIGKVDKPNLFSQHEMKLALGDCLYLFSDGFQDQFGGLKGKKYMKGKMKNFVLSIHNQNMRQQQVSFENEFAHWKGDHEQIDDICVMGVRVT